MIEN
jgi:hypothetical protein